MLERDYKPAQSARFIIEVFLSFHFLFILLFIFCVVLLGAGRNDGMAARCALRTWADLSHFFQNGHREGVETWIHQCVCTNPKGP